ncbi:MAG: recombinase family protein [Candidatus Eisenbacteria bacterium]|nr:recombinase family protein [Candidatus Eisenbacteria bacterium]
MSRRRSPGDPSRAISYLRVSTDDQSGGIESQRAALAAYAAAHGLHIVAEHIDAGISGAAPLDRRPGLVGALVSLRDHGAGVLLAARRDRVARDPAIMRIIEAEISRLGATLITSDGIATGDDPGAVMLRGVLDLAAQYERGVIRARVKGGMSRLIKSGLSTGTPPLGYQVADDGRLIPSNESKAVARAIQLAAEGLTRAQIADRLTAEGYPARGSRWHPTTIQRMITRARRHGGPAACLDVDPGQ